MQIHRFSFWLIELVSEVGNWHCGLNCKKPQNSHKIMNVALAVFCSVIFIFLCSLCFIETWDKSCDF